MTGLKFSVGDIVAIRGDLQEGNDYLVYANGAMANMAGQGVQISGIASYDPPSYRIEEDGCRWRWTEDMLEDAPPIAEIPTADELCSLLGAVNERR